MTRLITPSQPARPALASAFGHRERWTAVDDMPLGELDLLLCTHLSVVVRSRIEFGDGGPCLDTALVIPRDRCEGDRPTRQSLLAAARRCVAALKTGRDAKRLRAASRLLVCVNGSWRALLVSAAQPTLPVPATLKGSDAMNTSAVLKTLAGASLAALVCGTAAAGTPEANYRQERANCLSGKTSQDRATCLKEAGAALQEARRGGLVTPSPRLMAENAVLRCQRQPVEDRGDCERLARGEGTVSGSVAQGAVVREVASIKMDPPAAGPVSEPKR